MVSYHDSPLLTEPVWKDGRCFGEDKEVRWKKKKSTLQGPHIKWLKLGSGFVSLLLNDSVHLSFSLFMWVQPESTRKLYICLWVAFITSCVLPYKLMGFMIGERRAHTQTYFILHILYILHLTLNENTELMLNATHNQAHSCKSCVAVLPVPVRGSSRLLACLIIWWNSLSYSLWTQGLQTFVWFIFLWNMLRAIVDTMIVFIFAS